MFESLGEKFERIFKNLRGLGAISERNIRDAMRDVKLALLEADVHFRVVKEFVKRVTEKAIGSDVLTSITPGQQVIKIVHDELINTMGGPSQPFSLQPRFSPARCAEVRSKRVACSQHRIRVG